MRSTIFTATPQVIDQAKRNAPGYELGSQATFNPALASDAAVRADQTAIERLAEQRGNFFYGGEADGRQKAIDAARGNIGGYQQGNLGQTWNLGALGAGFGQAGAAAQGREAPIDLQRLGMMDKARAGQLGVAGAMLDAAGRGPGPSAAQAQLDASTGASMRQQLALAGSGRGAGGGAAAFRQAAAQQAQIQGSANAQAGVLRAQEEAAWRQQQAALMGQAAGIAGNVAGQDLAAAQYTSGTNLQSSQQNDQFQLGMSGLQLGANTAAAQNQMNSAQLQLATEGLGHQINMGALSGSMGYEQLMNQIYGINMGHAQAQNQMNQAERAANMSLLGTGITAAATIGGTMLAPGVGTAGGYAAGQAASQGLQQSDIRSKRDIRPADDELEQTLRRLGVSGVQSMRSDAGRAGSQAEQFARETGVGFPVQFDRESGINREGFGAGYGGRTAAQQAVAQTGAHAFRYKDPERHGEGERVGPMAQELERTPAGRTVVSTQPDGTKAVDTNRLSLLNTSALGAQQRQQDSFQVAMADADERIRRLEAMLGAEKKKRSGFNVDLRQPDTEALDRSQARDYR